MCLSIDAYHNKPYHFSLDCRVVLKLSGLQSCHLSCVSGPKQTTTWDHTTVNTAQQCPKLAVVQVSACIGRVHQCIGEGQEEGPGVCALPQLQAHPSAQGWLVWQVSPILTPSTSSHPRLPPLIPLFVSVPSLERVAP